MNLYGIYSRKICSGKSCSRYTCTPISERQMGASMVEFVLVAPVLLFLGLGSLQIGLIYHAKTTLNYATFEAARVGAVNHAQIDPMMGELAYRLAPVYGGQGSEGSAGGAIVRAMADVVNPSYGNITILNPTQEMFDAWEMEDSVTGEMQIPNHHLRHQNPDIVQAGVNIHDANLLKIKAEYGYRLQVPLVGNLITNALQTMNPENTLYYQSGRIPLVSVATVRMQNEARRSDAVVSAATAVGEPSPDFDGSQQIVDSGQVVDNDDTESNSSCDPHGLGEPNDDLQSLLGVSDGPDGQSLPPGVCVTGPNFNIYGDEGGQSPLLSSGLNPC